MRQAVMQETEGTFAPGPHDLRPPPVARKRPLPATIALAESAHLLGLGLLQMKQASEGAGAALVSVGASLACSGARGEVRRPMRLLGASIALIFAALDLRSAQRRPARTAMAFAQLGFAAAWLAAEVRDRLRARRPPEPAFA